MATSREILEQAKEIYDNLRNLAEPGSPVQELYMTEFECLQGILNPAAKPLDDAIIAEIASTINIKELQLELKKLEEEKQLAKALEKSDQILAQLKTPKKTPTPEEKEHQNLIKKITAARATAKRLYEKLTDLFPEDKSYNTSSELLSGNLNTHERTKIDEWEWDTPGELKGLQELISRLEDAISKAKVTILKPSEEKSAVSKKSTFATVSSQFDEKSIKKTLKLKQRLTHGYAYLATKAYSALVFVDLPTISVEDRVNYQHLANESFRTFSSLHAMPSENLTSQLSPLVKQLLNILEIAQKHQILQKFNIAPEYVHTQDPTILPLKILLDEMIPFFYDLVRRTNKNLLATCASLFQEISELYRLQGDTRNQKKYAGNAERYRVSRKNLGTNENEILILDDRKIEDMIKMNHDLERKIVLLTFQKEEYTKRNQKPVSPQATASQGGIFSSSASTTNTTTSFTRESSKLTRNSHSF